MNFFFKIAAWLFHPLLMPLLGVILYFYVTPRFIIPEIVYSKLIVVFILTFLIPLLLIFLLKTTRVINSVHLNEVKDRRYPLMFQCFLFVLIIRIVFSPSQVPELYCFFVAILSSTITDFILVLFKFKGSLHTICISGISMFLIALSIHFKINVLVIISLLLLANGWVASSRMYTNSHSPIELLFGFFIGALPQLILLNYWL